MATKEEIYKNERLAGWLRLAHRRVERGGPSRSDGMAAQTTRGIVRAARGYGDGFLRTAQRLRLYSDPVSKEKAKEALASARLRYCSAAAAFLLEKTSIGLSGY